MTTQPMTCLDVADQLGPYLEGDLPAAARDAVDRHLAGCPSCAALVSDLDRLAADAAALPPLRPDDDLWPGIGERIAAPVLALDEAAARRPLTPRRHPAWRVAAAAAALVAVTAGVTHQLTLDAARQRGVAASTAPAPAAGAARLVDRRAAAAGEDVAGFAQAVYDQEIADLRVALDRRRGELDPATVDLLERNLQLIDAAIAQSRAALAADPRSAFLGHRLSRALDTKVQVLRAAAALPARS